MSNACAHRILLFFHAGKQLCLHLLNSYLKIFIIPDKTLIFFIFFFSYCSNQVSKILQLWCSVLQEWQFWSLYSKKSNRFGYHSITSNPASPLDMAEQASSNCIFEMCANLCNSLHNWKVKLDLGHGKNSHKAAGQRWCHRLKRGSVSSLWDNCTRDKLCT